MSKDSLHKQEFLKKIYKSYATLYISITNRCNIKCRHCSDIEMDLPDAKQADVIEWIKQIANSKSIKRVSFLGGEPFLCFNELINYIKFANSLGLLTTIVTNGYWAQTEEKVDSILRELAGLDSMIVSSDKYHLEFVDKKIVDNLINGCIKNNIDASINITAANKNEGEEIKSLYMNSYSKSVFINISPMFFYGAAKNLEIEKFNYFYQPQLLKDYCEIRSHTIDCEGKIYACCAAVLGNLTNFLYLGDLAVESYETIIERRDKSLLFHFYDNYGPSGLAKIISESPFKDNFCEMSFSHGCELCRWVLNNKNMSNYVLQELEKIEN
ncbi:MAG: radical SAM protein [Lachnospiraceae bacterium]|nr:radical SAM protein [Lachnospiraceae bacterium]